MMLDYVATGDKVHRYDRCLVIPFEGKRKVLSTSMHNGGYQENLTAIFNQDVKPELGKPYVHDIQEQEIKDYISKELGLDYDTVSYIATIVSMEDAMIKTESYDILSVTAITTASLEVNGGRVGEAATSYEKNGECIIFDPGTINIMVFVNADMTPTCMTRAIVTATEAKTAAIQELLGGSLRSSGIATGSGTDNIMMVADSESSNTLTYGGKHGKLGELIGRLVMETVKGSLEKHMHLSPKSQHSMLARLKRYGVDEKTYYKTYHEIVDSEKISMAEYMNRLHLMDRNEDIVTLVSLLIHLLDQLSWDLLSIQEVEKTGKMLLENIAQSINTQLHFPEIRINNKELCREFLLEAFVMTTAIAAIDECKKKLE